MQRHLTASVLFCLNDAQRRNNHCMCPSNRVDLLLVGGLKKEVQINKKPNSATIVYVFSGDGYVKGLKMMEKEIIQGKLML